MQLSSHRSSGVDNGKLIDRLITSTGGGGEGVCEFEIEIEFKIRNQKNHLAKDREESIQSSSGRRPQPNYLFDGLACGGLPIRPLKTWHDNRGLPRD